MKAKRLLSFLITLALLTSMLICAPASAAGNSKEIFNLNFEDGARLPKFTYGGTEYQTEDSMTKNWLGVKDNIHGKLGNKSLYLTTGSQGGSGVGCQLTVPAVPELQNIGSGTIVVSWDMVVDALEGSNEVWTYVTLYKKVTATGEIKSQSTEVYFTPSTFYWNYGSNHNNKLQTIGSKPENGKWHKYDLVFYCGTGKMELYQDGTLLKKDDYVPRTLDTAGGQEITGIGSLRFRVRSKDSNAKAAYVDNIRLRTYDSDETFYQPFAENFQTATKNSVANAFLQTQSGAVDFDVETGVYGKDAADQSIKIVRNPSVTGSKDVFYQHSGVSALYRHGGTVHIGFKLAFDKYESGFEKFSSKFRKYFYLQPSGGTGVNVFELLPGKLEAYDKTFVPVNWVAEKWYQFDVYVTPGNGSDVKNKATVYMNGKKMFENIELPDLNFSKINTLRIAQPERLDIYKSTTYFDDYTIEYTPAGITPKYPTVSLSSYSDSILVVDNDTILVDGEATVADVKAAISVNGGRGYVISAPNTVADDTANATDCYFYVRTPAGYEFTYPIVNRVLRYDQDFSIGTYSTGDEIHGWTRVAPSSGKVEGKKGGVKGLAGKASADQSYKNTEGTVIHNYTNSESPFAIEGKTTIEFSLLLNDPQASEVMNFAFKYKDANGDIKDSGIITLLYFKNNDVQAFTTRKSGQVVGSYSDNQWNKYAIEIDPKTFSANVYQNGELLMSKDVGKFMKTNFDATGCEMLNIYRFKYEHNTANTDANAYSAIDDFKVYTGSYDANADKLSVSSSDYLLNGNWIAITDETDVRDFERSISLSNSQRTTIFDDETMTSTDIADEDDIVGHDQYLAVETSGKAIHYYRIVDQNEDTVLLKKAIYSGKNANSLTEVNSDGALALDTYRVKIAYEKYNNEPESAYLILKSNLINTPYVMDDISFTQRELTFGLNEVESDTIEIKDTDEQLTAMVWNTDLVPYCEVTTTPTQKETPEIPVDKYTTPTTPTVAEIQTALNPSHPRLMVTDFDAIAQSIKTDSVYNKWYKANKGTANENQHSVEYRAVLYAGYKLTNEDGTQLSTSTFRDRVILFAFNYMINKRIYSGDQSYYKDKVWEYIEEGNSWDDWGHNEEFLNTADMIMAYAIAYDWLYNDWTEEERATIKDALVNKGLKYAKEIFDGNRNYSSWLNKDHNWTAWCDSAILTGALAIADEDEMGANLANKALNDIKDCYPCFAPDGAWNEGTGYGELSLRFLAIALSSLETALSSEFGHKYAQGLSDAGFANLYMFGKNESFGLNDNGGHNQLDFDFYYGKIFNDKYLNGLRYYQLQNLNANATVYDLIWYNNSNLSTNFLTKMPYDKYYSGVQTATMRAGGFFDNTTAFAGLHAGYNNVNHGHLDGGTFAYETNGVRWAIDLGSDDYGLYKYFEVDDNFLTPKNRWDYYRTRAEGHNTWVINPSDGVDQVVNAQGSITKHSFDNSKASYSIADLTNFYKNDASSAKRGLMLNKANGSLIVRDEISLEKSSELYWFMHTEADVEVSDDGKSAILTQDGRRLWVGIIDGDGTFTDESATPLETSPNPDEWSENTMEQNANEGVRKLSIKYTDKSGTLNQTVYMVELSDGQSAPANIPQATSLANWN